ncbi:uncharacterized protein LOC62_05G007766 [Vanrija pseudolonga]|uniref:Copper acquisition factor BIM1-like domain-containing protein n=1 Tax=Vanrija pseudolonga TaxID=143232 RepID=A0AAF0YFU9_9TREE|nr:hypothetical protein LOC62_05G007766 [Vanrija pseudolonga]
MLAALGLLAAAGAVSAASSPDITTFKTSPVAFTYPPPRAFSASSATAYPCGGADLGARVPYPVTGGKISIDATTLAANVNIMYANKTNPTLFHDFSTYTDTVLDMSVGEWCAPGPDFHALGQPAGTNVTLLIIYQFYGNDSNPYYYTCADINLVDDGSYAQPAFTCSNTSALLNVASPKDSLVLHGSNFSDAQSGADGENVTITATPTAPLAAASTLAAASAAGSAAAKSSAAKSAASASASASAKASSARALTAGAGVAAFAMLAAMVAL